MKFEGKLGYAITQETEPGIWVDSIIEKCITGNTISVGINFENHNEVIPDLNLASKVSILMDSYVKEHFGYIKYVEFKGTRWSVKSVDIQYPRLILTLGGLYNG